MGNIGDNRSGRKLRVVKVAVAATARKKYPKRIKRDDIVVDCIHHFYREGQKESHISDYMSCQPSDSDLDERMRAIVIDWLVRELRVSTNLNLMDETLFLAVTLMDRFLCEHTDIVKTGHELQLVALTSLLLASKYGDMQLALSVNDCVAMSRNAYTSEQVASMEVFMIQTLQFNLTLPTSAVFLKHYLQIDVDGGDSHNNKLLQHLAFYLIELCLLHFESSINWEPSMVAAAAIYTARHTLHRMPAWTRQLQNHARYHQTELKPCATMILRFHHLAQNTAQLKSVYDKYSHPHFHSVAKLPPAASLP